MDIKEVNRKTIDQFRAGGAIDGMHRELILLLTTVGARTGHRHTAPMMFIRDADHLLVVASNMGAPKHPDWYLNLAAHPEVTVEIGDEKYQALARALVGSDYERAWSMIKQSYSFFADHERTAGRTIPVVALERT